jgi:release factor glutamine methyltransferase
MNRHSTKSNLSFNELYRDLKSSLLSDEADLEARIILENVLEKDFSSLMIDPDYIISSNSIAKIERIRELRNLKKIPLAYILEEAYFMGFKLFVNSDVLIPRPETEILVEKVLEEIKFRKIHHPVILDLGTGSGAIAIALKKALPASKIYASDISKAALNIAALNAKNQEVDINFIWADYLDPFINRPFRSQISIPIFKSQAPYFDVLVSNPPYISEEDYKKLEPEVMHEPKHALLGFPYAQIKEQSQGLIKKNGFIAMEFGFGQSEKILNIFPNSKIFKDLAGIDRIFIE